jgi:hypothetical protein
MLKTGLDYEPFGQINMHFALDFCLDQPGRIRMYQKLKNFLELTVLIYILFTEVILNGPIINAQRVEIIFNKIFKSS